MDNRLKNIMIIVLIIPVLFIYLYYFQTALTGYAIYESQPGPEEGNDTHIREGLDINYGEDITLRVGKSGSGLERRSIIKFNLSSIPESDTITEAVISLKTIYSSEEEPIIINIYRITEFWKESETTWYNRTNSEEWNNQGADYYGEIIDSIEVNNEIKWNNITITETVRKWINKTNENYGIILIPRYNISDGNYREFPSSNWENSSERPKIIIEHSENAPPTIQNITTNSNENNPIKKGENITFSIEWSDLENDEAKTYICQNNNISEEGCGEEEFCFLNYTSENPKKCNYTVTGNEEWETDYWAKTCDLYGCSEAFQGKFYVYKNPSITLIQPTGGETINQSEGNYDVLFEIIDPQIYYTKLNLYYGEEKNSTSNIIEKDINISDICTTPDIDDKRDCLYSWNTTGIYGDYYLTVETNDSFSLVKDSSDNNFSVVSLIDEEAPNITSQWKEETEITSGQEVNFYAEVYDLNLEEVWLSIKSTEEKNITMTNITENLFYSSWIAESIGEYSFKVYARDKVGNINNTKQWIEFYVSKPNTSISSINYPEKALPYHTIKISAELNASDPLKDVNAYLHAPEGFGFMKDYPQDNYIGNFSENETKTTEWFLSTPLEEGTYELNITFTDKYSNQWNTSSFEIQVTSSAGDYDLNLEGYREVVGGEEYYAEAYFDSSGRYTDPDLIEISIYDSVENLIIDSASMTKKETGKYNYTYFVPSTAVEGQWQTIVNATKDSENYYSNNFWKVVGGPFDVRNIGIIDNTIEELEISVEAENTGDIDKDLFLEWNLTREDTNEQLHAGMETFMVPANSNRTWTIYPESSYLGEVKITFIGFYSDGEKAGAYRIFNTEESEEPSEPEEPSSGTGGGSGGLIKEEPEDKNLVQNFEFIDYQKIIFLTTNFDKKVLVKINNTGNATLNNLTLNLNGLDSSFYTVKPKTLYSLKPHKTGIYEITFKIKNFEGEREFFYNITSEKISKQEIGKINVLSIKDYLLKEIERLNEWISKLLPKANEENKKRLDECENLLDKTEINIYKENYIEANQQLKEAEKCIKNTENLINKQKKEFSFPKPEIGERFFLIITWILILLLIAIGIFIIYKLRRELNLVDYFSKKEEKMSSEKTEPKKDIFYSKLDDIKKKLGKK